MYVLEFKKYYTKQHVFLLTVLSKFSTVLITVCWKLKNMLQLLSALQFMEYE